MKNIALIAFCLVMTGCASLSRPPEDLWMIQKRINQKWTSVSDQAKWGTYHYDEGLVTGDEPFSSDCEEYASAAKYQLEKAGYKALTWVVIERTGTYHAVTCTVDGEWCLDNLTGIPAKRDALGYQWVKVM